MSQSQGHQNEEPGEYRLLRIKVDPVGRTSCTVSFQGSDDGENWQTLGYQSMSIPTKRLGKIGGSGERKGSDGLR